jgi:ABC-type dipeptide/oligopeptide/nickel transport system permease component
MRGRMILRRLLWVFPVAFGVVTLTFFMARVFNGDPTELYAPPEATDALRAQIRAQLGLADPLPVQYFHYLADLLHFNLGTSFTTGQSVASDLSDRLPATLELGLVGSRSASSSASRSG